MPTSTKKRKSPSSSSRSGSSLFDALSTLEKLENDDVQAAKKRRRASTASASKSLAAQAQTTLAGELIQCRILLQRALQTTVSVMSEGTNGEGDDANERHKEEPRDTGGDDETTPIKSADQLLTKLLEARNKLTKVSNIETERLSYDGSLVSATKSSNDSDAPQCPPLDHILKSEYVDCRSEWQDTFNRRHHDLRLHAGLTAKAASKFRVIDQSFWNQVESAVSHERLIQKEGSSNRNGKLFDNSMAYMYDDSKVYQHMLRDFVALGASGGASSVNPSLAADAAAERLRRAAKKKGGLSAKDVDRKASKGRKIRYTVNPKLENFTFPVSRPVPSIGEDDWFRSLFGGAGTRKTTGVLVGSLKKSPHRS
jgi:protein AATF/BFR2